MTLRHVFVSLAVTCLVACSSDDTIVSLNVTATDRVPVVERMQVTFKQGSRSFVYDFTPPEDAATDDAPASIKNGFFERIALPGDWEEAEAQISVEAFGKGDAPVDPELTLTYEATVNIEPEGAVAAYVELDIPEPPPMGGAGGEGAGGAPSEAGQGGAPSNGGAPAGGEPNAGGVAGDASLGGASLGGAGAGGAG